MPSRTRARNARTRTTDPLARFARSFSRGRRGRRVYLVPRAVVAPESRSSRAAIRPHCSSLPAPGRLLHCASWGRWAPRGYRYAPTQPTPAGSITQPSFRSNRLQAGYRPPAHCLSASAMHCSLAPLARHRAVVAVVAGPARPSGRVVAAAPRPSPHRGAPTSALPLAHIPAARSSRSSRPGRLGLPPSRPRVRPVGRRPRFRSGESMFARVRGLPPLSVRTVR